MRNVNYCIRLKGETLETIKALAIQKKRPVSQLIRLIIEDYVEKVNL